MIIPQTRIHEVRSTSVSTRENVRLIVPHQPRPGAGADDSIGTSVVELDVVLIWRGI